MTLNEKIRSLERQLIVLSIDFETGRAIKYRGESWRINQRGDSFGMWSIYKTGNGFLKEVPISHIDLLSRIKKMLGWNKS